MKVAEEVFLIVRELSKDRSFRWKDWERAWTTVRPLSHRWQTKPYSHVARALKSQVLLGTIKRLDRGLYFFVQDRPSSPLYVRGELPNYPR